MKRPGWLVWLILVAFALYLLWPRNASSSVLPVFVYDESGAVVLACDGQIQLNKPTTGAMRCRLSDTFYNAGFEGVKP